MVMKLGFAIMTLLIMVIDDVILTMLLLRIMVKVSLLLCDNVWTIVVSMTIEKVKKFIGEYHPKHYLLNKDENIAVGPMDLQPYLMEHKFQQSLAMQNAKQVILDVSKEFEELTGRHYELFEEYKFSEISGC